MGTDWSKWHDAYDRADSSLGDRLTAVRAAIARRLDDAAPGPMRVISACAGDGRDLLGVLAQRPDSARVSALLVEYDAGLVSRARRTDVAPAKGAGRSHTAGARGDEPARRVAQWVPYRNQIR